MVNYCIRSVTDLAHRIEQWLLFLMHKMFLRALKSIAFEQDMRKR